LNKYLLTKGWGSARGLGSILKLGFGSRRRQMLLSFDVDLLISFMVVKVVDLRTFGLVDLAPSAEPFVFSLTISRVDMVRSRSPESTSKVLHSNIRGYYSYFVRKQGGQG
jgi:hypothetical protein